MQQTVLNKNKNAGAARRGPSPRPQAGLGSALQAMISEYPHLAAAVFLPAGAILAFALLHSMDGQRLMLVFGGAVIFLYLILKSPRLGIPVLLVYMAFLGTIRRLFVLYFGYTGFDPLQVVAPFVTLVYMSFLLVQRDMPHDTRLSLWIGRLLLLMTLEMFNPGQGSFTVGIAGGLFYIAPLGWFYVGRSFGAASVVRSVLFGAIALAFLAAIYGLYQTWFGFQSWELDWLKYNKAAALMAGTSAKAFSFFNAFAEYTHFAAIGLLIAWAAILRGNRLLSLLLPVFLLALFISASRGIMISSLLAMCLLWAVQGKNMRAWMPRLALAAVVGAAGFTWSLQQISTEHMERNTQVLVAHQQELLDPTHTTAGFHAFLLTGGIMTGFTHPAGMGLGITTLAAGKFGGEGVGSETDVGDMFISLGFIGGLIYLGIIVLIFRACLRCWQETRSWPSLAMLGIMVVEQEQWLHAGHYAPQMVIWFLIGALDRWQAAHPIVVSPAIEADAPEDAKGATASGPLSALASARRALRWKTR